HLPHRDRRDRSLQWHRYARTDLGTHRRKDRKGMTDWVFRLLDDAGYWGVMFLMFIETVFPPIPSEVIMSLAGVRAGQGTMSLWGVIGAGTAGAMFGN